MKIKKEFKSKLPTPISRPTPKPKTPKPSSKPKGAFKSILKGAKEGALKSLTTKGKQPQPRRRGGAEKLQPSKGWESCYPQGDLRKKNWTMTRTVTNIKTKTRRRRRKRWGLGLDVQKWLEKTGIEFHWPGYQYMGPGTKLEKRLKRGDLGINRLDRIAKQHDIDYSKVKNLQDKWKADAKMIESINKLPGIKTMTERIVRKIMQAKKRLKF